MSLEDRNGWPSESRAYTLVEILVALFILIVSVIPLVGLLTSGKTDQQSEEGMSEAVAFCQDMMEKIISNNLPFQAIDPGGGGEYVKGGPDGTVSQAGFRDLADPVRGMSFKRADLDKILSDGDVTLADGKYRSKRVKGKTYHVAFFAGKYPDRDPIPDSQEQGFTRADFDNTLTFCCVPNPVGLDEPWNVCDQTPNPFNRQVILDGSVKIRVGSTDIESNPYQLRSYLVITGATPKAELVDRDKEYFLHDPARNIPPGKSGYSLIAGWPDPSTGANGDSQIKYDLRDPDSDQRGLWIKHLGDVVRGVKKPTIAYHPKIVDQHTFNSPNGGLMKVILGVKFYPYEHSTMRKNTGEMREFWLLSFKADLED